MSPEIRTLTPADAADYRALRLRGLSEAPTAFAASAEEEGEMPELAFADRLAESADRRTFGAHADQALVGILTLLREPKRKLRHKALIVGVYVAPEARQRGLGGKLLHEALRHAEHTMGVRQVNLSVNAANRPALALYESAGFVAFGTETACMIVDGVPQDEVHMVRHFTHRP